MMGLGFTLVLVIPGVVREILKIPDGSTARDVLELSYVLDMLPEIGLATQKVGIFGKLTRLDTVVGEGNRIGVYWPIAACPETVERRNRLRSFNSTG